jgi:hypothetical protein
MSNLLAMPLIDVGLSTFNNEDWVDSIQYCVTPTDGSTPDPSDPQLDLRGINFTMDLRVNATDNEVVFQLSSTAGTILIGLPPNWGFLIFYVPVAQMKYLASGTYVGDVVGTDPNYQRTVASMTITVNEGVTR